jgi:Cupin domain
MAKRIDVTLLAPVIGTHYPTPFDKPCRTRERRKLGDAAGLRQFGVNLLRLPPGAWSSQRHWHTKSVYVVAGEVTLVTDAGDEVLRAGDAAGFKAGGYRRPLPAESFDGRCSGLRNLYAHSGRCGPLLRHRHDGLGGQQASELHAPRRHALRKYPTSRAWRLISERCRAPSRARSHLAAAWTSVRSHTGI